MALIVLDIECQWHYITMVGGDADKRGQLMEGTAMDYSDIVREEFRVIDGNLNGGTPHDKLLLKIDHESDDDVSLITRSYYGNDGTPMDEWDGRVSTITLLKGPTHAALDALREDLKEGGKLSVLIKAFLDLRDSEDEDERSDAWIELEMGIEHLRDRYVDETWSHWDAGVWLKDCTSEVIALKDDEVANWVAQAEAQAEADKVTLDGDVEEWVREVRAQAKADAED